jgi:hypothetical protein
MIMFSMFIAFVTFVAFPESKEALLSNVNIESINVESSGSLGFYRDGVCHKTHPNETLISNERYDWCSNIAKFKDDKKYNPWIQYSIKGKQMKIFKYSVRNGCCFQYECCCDYENGNIIDDSHCCCRLYSYSLQASNDNKTWTVLHKVEKDKSFNYCETKTFELKEKSSPFTYFRFVLDEESPGCYKCMQINQIELYGETISSSYSSFIDNDDEDESISIIGRVKKDEQ